MNMRTLIPLNVFPGASSPIPIAPPLRIDPMSAADQLDNPFTKAQQKWDEVNRNLMLVTDELAQTKGIAADLTTAVADGNKRIVEMQVEHDKAISQMLADHVAAIAARDEEIAKLTRERDTFKTLSIQQTVRLRDFGETALRIVNDSRVATMNDPALDAYAKPLVPAAQPPELSDTDKQLLSQIVGTETAAAA